MPDGVTRSADGRWCALLAGQTAAETGRNGKPKWALPRRHGRTLRAALRTALALPVDLICIGSWNNYADGSFIEPNSLDGDRLCTALRQAVAAAKAGGPSPVSH